MDLNQTEVVFKSNKVSLAGTLTLPSKHSARAIIVFSHGSGPLDRDGNAQGMPLNIFSELSKQFAAEGFASFRYDKRGVGASTGRFGDTSQADLIDDLKAAATFAKANVDAPLILCGHSEGTSLAAAVATDVRAAGLVLICPYLATGADLLRQQAANMDDQMRAVPGLRGWAQRRLLDVVGWPSRQQATLIDRIVHSSAPVLRVRWRSVPVSWLRDFIASDQHARHSAHSVPCLILAAEHDAQCPPEDGAAIAALGPNRDAVTLPGLSHLLRLTDGPDLADYARQLREPMDGIVPKTILSWLQSRVAFGG